MWSEACGQRQAHGECGAAGADHPQPPSASVMALGVTLGPGRTFVAFPVPPAANAQTVVAADVVGALSTPVSLEYLLLGTIVVMYLLLLTGLWRSCER